MVGMVAKTKAPPSGSSVAPLPGVPSESMATQKGLPPQQQVVWVQNPILAAQYAAAAQGQIQPAQYMAPQMIQMPSHVGSSTSTVGSDAADVTAEQKAAQLAVQQQQQWYTQVYLNHLMQQSQMQSMYGARGMVMAMPSQQMSCGMPVVPTSAVPAHQYAEATQQPGAATTVKAASGGDNLQKEDLHSNGLSSLATVCGAAGVGGSEPGGGTGAGRARTTSTGAPKRNRRTSLNFVCTMPGCKNRRFRDSAHLRRHFASAHGMDDGKPRFQCNIGDCSHSYRRRVHLVVHQRREHGVKVSSGGMASGLSRGGGKDESA